jgi:acetyl coenzyme A synthetase (ADP forming)-like protein
MSSPVLPDVCDVVLRDGSTVVFRPSTEADVPPVRSFFEHLSRESQYERFFGLPYLDDERTRRLIAETQDSCVLLAWCGRQIVGVAGFYRSESSPQRAEVAFAIADALQGRGLGTRLLERLAEHARARNITRFDADVLCGNRRMFDVFADSGFALTSTVDSGVTHVVLSLDPSSGFEEKAASRARVAATASLRPFFEPRSVAVVGANRSRGKIGSELFHNLIAAGFTGALYAVHPNASEIEGRAAYPSVSAIPGEVDLAVVVVPADDVLAVVEDCIAKGVRGICVISAGFGETGPSGAVREAELLIKVRDAGCRLIGPNCMGLLNTDRRFRLNATFSPVYPPEGQVAMSTQSGALGLAILDYARRLNIGISSFVSVGNKADVSGNDLIQYWADDPHTSVILLYLESFGNPKKFTELARRVSRTKPIVAVKAGRSAAGARAASSHTGALAASDTVVDALFRDAGVIRTARLEELFDVAALLSHQPLPAGRRVAIVTNAGGPGILAADACEGQALELAQLSDETRAKLRAFLPAAANVENPVDMLASAPPEHYAQTMQIVLGDPSVDSVIAIFIPPLVTEAESVAAAIREAAARSAAKPVLAVMMRAEGAPPSLSGIPAYAFPESAATALARATTYAEWRGKPEGVIPVFNDVRPEEVRAPIEAALSRGGGWLTVEELNALLSAVGIRFAETRHARTPDDAARIAEELGFPVVLKALGPALLHKTEHGAVILDLADPASVRSAANDLLERLGDKVTGFSVQRLIRGGVEMLIGCVNDALFGPVVVCGSGGVLAELQADVARRLHPLRMPDAAEMLDEIKSVRLLRGYRGLRPLDEGALRDALLRISNLLTICPEIQELDLNPIKVLERGVCVVDARARVERNRARPTNRRVMY